MKRLFFLLILFSCYLKTHAQVLIDFESISLEQDTFWDGSDQSGGFQMEDLFFPNFYNTDFFFWQSGWALSSKKDSITSDFTNLFSAKPASGFEGSTNYAVGQQNAVIHIQNPFLFPQRMRISNTTYAHGSMRDGDGFAKKFGGPDGEDPDFFKLTIRAFRNGQLGQDSVEFYLADYRFEDNSLDYIVNTWEEVDLSSLYGDSLLFTLSSSDVGEHGINTPLFFCIDQLELLIQFPPGAGQVGSTAMHTDSTAFVAWATGATLERGSINIADPNAAIASTGDTSLALGKAGSNGIVSLGDGGSATLTFDYPITNGPGWDFAVFENGFFTGAGYFLELAHVEVSSDGIQFFRFPSTSLTDTTAQVDSFGLLNPTKIHNLAGKYELLYGTPFDLEELAHIEGLNINRISHVRLIDVVGSLNEAYTSRDANGNKINDPWPTAFESCGFDLDAVGVIHENRSTPVQQIHTEQPIWVFPNPIKSGNDIQITGIEEAYFRLFDASGRLCAEGKGDQISTRNLAAGIYCLSIETNLWIKSEKIIISP